MKRTLTISIFALLVSACSEAEVSEPPQAEAPAPPPVAAPTATEPEAPREPAAPAVKKSEGPKVTVERRDEPEVNLDAELTIKRLVIAEGVKDREPVGAGDSFTVSDDRIYAFVEIGNAERAPSQIFVSFVREGERERGRIPLRIGASPRWRTWAYTRLVDQPGTWQAIVRDARGREIGRADFEVTADQTASVKKVGEPHI